MQPQDQQNQNTNQNINFDPTRDIDISNLEIIDTSRGDVVDYNSVAFNKIYRLKCLNCGFTYEGKNFLERCPKCGSTKLDDTDTTQVS